MRASNLNAPHVVYQDEAIFVIVKPAGMPSVSLQKGMQDSLAAWIKKKFPNQAKIGKASDAGLAHRLDNDTSGLIVVAKTNDAYENLRRQFSGHSDILKEYTALVIGSPPNEGSIVTPIAHHSRKKKKMIVCESDEKTKTLKARSAITSFEVLKRYKSPHDRRKVSGNQCPTPPSAYSLLRVRIVTGVRHQIRVHLASIGFPIAGDRLYQNPKKRLEDTLPLKRHFLHASRLGFIHPKTGKWIEVKSALPDELKEVLALCRRV